ncbi:MAG: acyl-CoA dehydrogenase family protein [Polyangiaceae bacterium]
MLAPTDRARETVTRVREFVQNEVFPAEAKVAELGIREAQPFLESLRDRARTAGLWAPQVPREHGGMGLSFLEYAFVSEELGRSPLGHWVVNAMAPDAGNIELLMHHADDALKKRFLGPLVAGKIRSCFSMTEPDHAGSNPVWMSTRAEKQGDDYVITGRKWFTTGADGAAFAIVMAVTNPEADSPYARASQIIVPADTPGFRVVRNIAVMGEAGAGWASHSEVSYDQVRVPQSNRIGPEGAGFMLAQERLGPGRIHHCMRWVGICERAMDLMCRRAATREIAPGKPLATRQIVQEWIADSRAEIHASRLMVLNAAEIIDKSGTYAARDEIGIIKFYVAGVLQRVLDRAIQVHGALGLTDETPLAVWYRHERAARIYDGPDEVHKVVVARRTLKKYGVDVR